MGLNRRLKHLEEVSKGEQANPLWWECGNREDRGELLPQPPLSAPTTARLYRARRLQDEQAFRFNERDGEDTDRSAKTLGAVAERRLTYDELTGRATTE